MKRLLNKYLPLAYGAYFNSISIFSIKKAAEKAFYLFCAPRKGKVLPDQASFLNKAKNGTIKVGTTTIQTYQWVGGNDTVLLLHGWESNTFRWRNLIVELQKEEYNIFAMDAPAHGNSSGNQLNVPLYAECTQHVIEKYNPKYIIGHSVGGMTTIYNQYKYPNSRIEKIVSLGAPSELSEIMAHYKSMLNLNNRVMMGLDDYFIYKFGFRINEFSTTQFVREISKKGLLVHDELDQIAPFISSEKVHANWKDSKLIKTKGLGHSLHQDDVRDQIIAFLKS